MNCSLIFLTYAKQARAIVNLARVNEDPKARMIRGNYRVILLPGLHIYTLHKKMFIINDSFSQLVISLYKISKLVVLSNYD